MRPFSCGCVSAAALTILLTGAFADGDSQHSLEVLIRLLTEGSDEDRLRSAAEIRRRGRKARKAIPALLAALDDRKHEVTSLCSDALAEQGSASVPHIVRALEMHMRPGTKSIKRVRLAQRGLMIDILGRIGPDAIAAVPTLSRVYNGDDVLGVRLRAVRALWKIQGRTQKTVDLLVEGLRAGIVAFDESACAVAADTLAEIGSDAHVAVPALLDAVAVDPRRRHFLTGPDMGIIAAEKALASIGEKAIPALVRALGVKGHGTAASRILSRIGEPAVPYLSTAVAEGNTDRTRWALYTLALIGKRARPAIPAVKRALERSSGHTLVAAGWAYWAITADPSPAVNAYSRALQDASPSVRAAAAKRLGQMGVFAKPALPALAACIDDPDSAVRRAALSAIEAIRR
jgi:HEAT repeat protein